MVPPSTVRTVQRRLSAGNIALTMQALLDSVLSSTMPGNAVTPYKGTVLQVAVPTPLRQLFDYLPPTDLEDPRRLVPGVRLLLPFGRRKLVGILIDCITGSDLPRDKLKPALELLDEAPLFQPTMFKMLQWASGYYHYPLGEVLHVALPSLLRSGHGIDDVYNYWEVSAADPDELLARAPRQHALYEFARDRQRLRREQVADAGFDPALLRELVAKQLLVQKSATVAANQPFTSPARDREWTLALNECQQQALAQIESRTGNPRPVLLDGITGSGKTEVYMRLIHNRLALGQQALVLVPEIGLTPQTVRRFQQSFDCPVVALHSGLSDRERLLAWKQAKDGAAAIIIGTRSAVFTPMANPGLIIIDEEHDPSFKQQEGFRYSARDLAVIRGHEEGIPVVLGSATPSLESLHNCAMGKFERIVLQERAGGAVPATMELVDVAEQVLSDGIAESVLVNMQRHLADGNQVLVFINRRGFAPILSCQVCTWQSECENCVAQMTVHRSPPQLRCHHCDATRPIPRLCPVCKSADLTTFGHGTQKLQQFFEQRFPETPLFRVDRDSTRSKDSFHRLADEMENGGAAILLGTQMLAKGHHFPGITLVVVIDADSGLFSADFRGQEQMSQTLIQVSGRAGRAQRKGEVMIQTRHATHPALLKLVQEGYGPFAEYLLAERRESHMPPYTHLCLLRSEAGSLKQALGFLGQARNIAVADASAAIQVHGPLAAPMEKRAGRFRGQLLLKSESRPALQNLLRRMVPRLDELPTPGGLRWSLDVDPVDLI